jgi:hypothetical protein
MPNVSGSIRKVTLDGITYQAKSSANFKETVSEFTNEAVATSGDNLRKMTKRPNMVDSVELIVNGAERDTIKVLADGQDDIPMSYETAAGDVYRAVGWIELESRETEENTVSVKMYPRDNTWESFLSS